MDKKGLCSTNPPRCALALPRYIHDSNNSNDNIGVDDDIK